MGKLKPWVNPTKRAALPRAAPKGFPPFQPCPLETFT